MHSSPLQMGQIRCGWVRSIASLIYSHPLFYLAMFEQWIVFGVILAALVLFAWGKWRYDVVALLALVAISLVPGALSRAEIFSGFAHPAVITVAAVLVMSYGLISSGAVDVAGKWILKIKKPLSLQILLLTGIVTIFSGFINNVGALAIFMPIAIQMARKSGQPVSLFLMPIAFGSLLGGMTTLVGTPPNLIISSFRENAGLTSFGMFDFLPVGAGVALVGLLFLSLIGWRLLPRSKTPTSPEEFSQVMEYLTEVKILEDSKLVGKPIGGLEKITEADVAIVGIIRGKKHTPAPSSTSLIKKGDILIVEADQEELKKLVAQSGVNLVPDEQIVLEELGSEEVSLAEAIVTPHSPMENHTARELNLRQRFKVNLLAISRRGQRLSGRLRDVRFQSGDILLLQGKTEQFPETLKELGCFPLAERELRLGRPQKLITSLLLFALAVITVSLGLLPVELAFTSCALLMLLFGVISLNEAYKAINWSVIVLLGAMIPLSIALENSGGADFLVTQLLGLLASASPLMILAFFIFGTMLLSNLVNNAAAAVLVAPVAMRVAQELSVSQDTFLMGVAIGASAAFMTPIGHQSNVLVMIPGGYHFRDYFKLGLPLSLIILSVTIPLLLWVWPL